MNNPEIIVISLLNSGERMHSDFVDGAFLAFMVKRAAKAAGEIVYRYRQEHHKPVTAAAFEELAKVHTLKVSSEGKHVWTDDERGEYFINLKTVFDAACEYKGAEGDTVAFWLDRLRRNYVKCESEDVIRGALKLLSDGDEDAAVATLSDGSAVLADILRDKEAERPVSLSSAIEITWDNYTKARDCPDTSYGILTGFTPFDRLTRGVRPGELTIFASRPKVGKSLALNTVTVNAFNAGKFVGYVNIEMDPIGAYLRFVSAYTGVPSSDIRFGRLADTHQERARMEAELYDRLQAFLTPEEYGIDPRTLGDVYFFPRGMRSIRRVVHEVERIEAEVGRKFDLLVWDYINIVEPDLSGKANIRMSAFDIVKESVEQLRDVAYRLRVPIVTANQINRQGAETNTKGKRVGLEVLSGSDSVGMTADAVMLMYRTAQDREMGTLSIDPVAVRNFGGLDEFKMTADYPCNWFYYNEVTEPDFTEEEEEFRDQDEESTIFRI